MVLLTSLTAFAQEEQRSDSEDYRQFQGEILDSESREPLVFATLILEEHNISTITNSEGEFLLKIPREVADGYRSASSVSKRQRSS